MADQPNPSASVLQSAISVVSLTKAANANTVGTLTVPGVTGVLIMVSRLIVHADVPAASLSTTITVSLDGGVTTAFSLRWVLSTLAVPVMDLSWKPELLATAVNTSVVVTIPALGAAHPLYIATVIGRTLQMPNGQLPSGGIPLSI